MADRSEGAGATAGDSPPVVDRTVPPGSDERAEAVWALKELIKRLDGLLVQRRPFFDAQYRQSTCYLSVALGNVGADGDGAGEDADAHAQLPRSHPSVDGTVGFALVTQRGYLSLLGVAPSYRRQGIGSRLLARITADHPAVACHVRTSNDGALGFYVDHGFVVDGRDEGYYRDGTDAYRLVRDPERADRLTDVLS